MIIRSLSIAGAIAIVSASFVSAHVTIDPKEAVVGRQIFYVRVPNERPTSSTIRVRLVIPDDVEVTGILPLPGWQYIVTKSSLRSTASSDSETSSEHIQEIVWSGGRIRSGELMLFGISTRYQGEPKELKWNAYQTYDSGEVVAWDGSDEGHPSPSVIYSRESQIDTARSQIKSLNDAERRNRYQLFAVSGVSFILSIAALMIALKGRKISV